MAKKVLAMVLAGGKGSRLYPLTKERAKPAVPFGGRYRTIDFVLSNLANSGICSIYVLTQFKAQSLLQHLHNGWSLSGIAKDRFITAVPAQMRSGESWYQGTADAIYQNIDLIKRFSPDIVAVFGADHIYRMDVRQMLDFHEQCGAAVTIAALPVECKQAAQYGVLEVDSLYRVTGFQEKPASPSSMPQNPEFCLASMGNYLFDARLLMEKLCEDAREDSSHDFGKDILPQMCKKQGVYAYNFSQNQVPGVEPGKEGYWCDIGTIPAYWQANMQLRSSDPAFDLYNNEWPVHTASHTSPPTRFIHGGSGAGSLISEGCSIAGNVKESILGRNVIVGKNTWIENSIIMDEVEIGEDCMIRNAIIDKFAKVKKGTAIGYDSEIDVLHGCYVDPSGIVVVARKGVIPCQDNDDCPKWDTAMSSNYFG